jgi:hypothetical protein
VAELYSLLFYQKTDKYTRGFLKFFARGGEICLPFLRLQKDFRKQRKNCDIFFLAKIMMFTSLARPKEVNRRKGA